MAPEDLGEEDIALGPHIQVKTWFSTETGHRYRGRLLQDLLVLQGTTKSP